MVAIDVRGHVNIDDVSGLEVLVSDRDAVAHHLIAAGADPELRAHEGQGLRGDAAGAAHALDL
jgi:hypothetical protein